MAYKFENQDVSKTTSKFSNENLTHTLQGINSSESSADVVVAGLSYLYGIVGWDLRPTSVVRVVNEDVVNDE